VTLKLASQAYRFHEAIEPSSAAMQNDATAVLAAATSRAA